MASAPPATCLGCGGDPRECAEARCQFYARAQDVIDRLNAAYGPAAPGSLIPPQRAEQSREDAVRRLDA